MIQTRYALALLAAAAAAGCASGTAPSPPAELRIAPLRQVAHGGVTGDAVTGQAYAALARQYESEGRAEAAIEAWGKAIAQDPSNAAMHNALGMALAARGRYADAVAAFGRADVFAPRDARTLNNLGYSQLMAGQHAAAARSLEQALALDPQHAKARANLDAAKIELARAERVTVRLAGGEEIGVPAVLTRHSSATPAQAASALTERVTIVNGNGVPGAAGRMRDIVRERGVLNTGLANLPRFDAVGTQVIYRDGYAGYARQVARRLPLSSEIVMAPGGETGAGPVRVVIGADARASAVCLKLGGCLATVDLTVAQAGGDAPLDIAALAADGG